MLCCSTRTVKLSSYYRSSFFFLQRRRRDQHTAKNDSISTDTSIQNVPAFILPIMSAQQDMLLLLPVEVLQDKLVPFLSMRDSLVFGAQVCKTVRESCLDAIYLALLEREHGVSRRECEAYCSDPSAWIIPSLSGSTTECPCRSPAQLMRTFEEKARLYSINFWRHEYNDVENGAPITEVDIGSDQNLRSFGQLPPTLGDAFSKPSIFLRKSRPDQRYRLRIRGGTNSHHGILRVAIAPCCAVTRRSNLNLDVVLPKGFSEAFIEVVGGGGGGGEAVISDDHWHRLSKESCVLGDVDWYAEDNAIVVRDASGSGSGEDSFPLAFRLKRSCRVHFEFCVVGKHRESQDYWMCLTDFTIVTEDVPGE